MTVLPEIVSAVAQGGKLNLVVAVGVGTASTALVQPPATLRDMNGRDYPVHTVGPAGAALNAGQFGYVAEVGQLPPGSDPPSYVLTIDGQQRWFAPASPRTVATGGHTPVTARAGADNDYRGRDYDFFVALMRAAIAQQVGGDSRWALDHAADPMTTLVEGLAFGADHLSFRQDAAGTEAYLSTARERLSLRRHARLRDYAVNDGCAARTALVMIVAQDGHVPSGTTAVSLQPGVVGSTLPKDQPLAPYTIVYETMTPLAARVDNNELGPMLAADTAQTLPVGAIALTLQAQVTSLMPGSLLVLNQPYAPAGGVAFGAHVVRLLRVEPGTETTVLRWHPEDALPRALTIPSLGADGGVSLHANVVLADHGRSVNLTDIKLPIVGSARYEPVLALDDPVLAAPPPPIAAGFDGTQEVSAASLLVPSARESLTPDPRDALLALALTDTGPSAGTWFARNDLLATPGSAPSFGATIEAGLGAGPRQVRLRFGDGVFGRRPTAGTQFTARARTGDGLSGRIRANTLMQLWNAPGFVTAVFNPLPAEPVTAETAAAVRLFAASGFTVNQRGITPDDWQALAEADPLVLHAKAHAAPDGGGPCTIGLVTADPQTDTFPIARDRLFAAAVLTAEPTITIAKTVPLTLALSVYCRPGVDPGAVRTRLRQRFGSGRAGDGTAAYFHPSRWPLGRSVVLRELAAAIATDPGVTNVITDDTIDPRLKFENSQRPETTPDNVATGVITVAANEYVRLANDPTVPGEGGFALFVVAAP